MRNIVKTVIGVKEGMVWTKQFYCRARQLWVNIDIDNSACLAEKDPKDCKNCHSNREGLWE